MQAVWFEDGRAEVVSRPKPRLRSGAVRIEVLLAGICRTDLELLAGYYGFCGVPGHEFVGRVTEAPQHAELVGRRVVSDINIACGHCDFCRAGIRKHCRHRRTMGLKDWPGALAEYTIAPVENIRLVPDGLPDDAAVLAEPLAAALDVARAARITPEVRTAVLGGGKLGLLVAAGLTALGAQPVLIGKHETDLTRARTLGLKPVRYDSGNAIPGGLYDVVVEATGRPEGAALALDLVHARGTVVVKTTSHQPSVINLAGLAVDEKTLVGSRCGDLAQALDVLASGRFDHRLLLEGVFGLDDFGRALDAARQPGAGKVLVKP